MAAVSGAISGLARDTTWAVPVLAYQSTGPTDRTHRMAAAAVLGASAMAMALVTVAASVQKSEARCRQTVRQQAGSEAYQPPNWLSITAAQAAVRLPS